MDFLNGKIKRIYFKYLLAAFGSALITSIYSIVDMAMVGQYQGPDDTAALAVVAPVWNIIYSLGLLMGIGGSVIFSTKRGSGDNEVNENQYFTSAVIGSVVLAMLSWIGLFIFEKPILSFFRADESLLYLAQKYIRPIKYVFPLFLFNQMLATAIGSVISFLIMLTHFIARKNTLRLVKVQNIFSKLREISITGFSTFFIDVAMGILTVLFNRQIMKFLGADALAVYGPIIQVSTFVQCYAYSVGQASQPIISINFGAKKKKIVETLKLALITTFIFGLFWTALSMICPNLYKNFYDTY